ncbi:hypothetical protein ABBQ32_007664 [Trebouxia sp. C0010 RCD-2024]
MGGQRNTSNLCDAWETSDYGGLDVERLRTRAEYYGHKAGASDKSTEALRRMLDSSIGRKIASLTHEQLFKELVNDAYKPKMHKIYSSFLRGVKVDFALNVRKSPFALKKIEQEDPGLFHQLNQAMADVAKLHPLNDNIEEVLKIFYSFDTPEVMRKRSDELGTAEVHWIDMEDGSHTGIASGTAEAASNAETTMTQLVQEYTVRAQVRALCNKTGLKIDRTERVANSLGHLAAVVDQLNDLDHPVKIALFAGRRSSDRAYLLLQTWFCAHNLKKYIGSSNIFACSHLNRILEEEGVHESKERVQQIGRLIGTHAHEVMSIVQHLMSHCDEEAGCPGKPVQVCAMLAHLLFLRANGGTQFATALSDTFGTEGFIAAALVTQVPDEFVEDIQQLYPDDRQIESGAMVFDVFTTWRLDSGDYSKYAEVVVSAWEGRCKQLTDQGGGPQGISQQRPALMHSNLKDVDHVKQVASLPERIRPTIVAFGGVADGFVPFEIQSDSSSAVDGDKSKVELELASIVMKAVQARHPQLPSQQECAAKHGDDDDLVKAQVDPRLPEEAKQRVKKWLADLFQSREVDGKRSSVVLAKAYHDITRKQILNM